MEVGNFTDLYLWRKYWMLHLIKENGLVWHLYEEKIFFKANIDKRIVFLHWFINNCMYQTKMAIGIFPESPLICHYVPMLYLEGVLLSFLLSTLICAKIQNRLKLMSYSSVFGDGNHSNQWVLIFLALSLHVKFYTE